MERAWELIGAAATICWVLVLGPVGAIILVSMAYAMANDNLILGVICALAALTPVFLGVMWGATALVARTKSTEPVHQASLGYIPLKSNARAVSE